MNNPEASFDVIIIGAGSAGCVLASRLSANSGRRVLLLEAGQDTPPGREPADVLNTYPMSYYNPDYAWKSIRGHSRGAEDSPAGPFRQGRIMGGTSSINGMVALRGAPEDYAEWQSLGAEGWSWDHVLPYFRKLETDTDITSDEHGTDGPIPIRRVPREDWPPFVDGVADWCAAQQIPELADLNSDFRDGMGALPLSRFADKRASTAICYLGSDVRARENLTIITGATVKNIVFDGTKVTGVEAEISGGTKQFGAEEVIVSAGALQSPAILLRAGVGPGEQLRAAGIDVVADRAGVGENLRNHQVVYVVAQLRRDCAQPAELQAHSAASLRFTSGVPGTGEHDMCMSISSKVGWHPLGRRIAALTPTILKPASRGSVTLQPDAPGGPAKIVFNYLSAETDRKSMIAGTRRAIEILLSPEVRPIWHNAYPVTRPDRMRALNDITTMNALRARFLAGLFDTVPAIGKPVLAGLSEKGADIETLSRDPEALEEAVEKSIAGVFHPGGTCRMGAADDPLAVTDAHGRVYGVSGLRVVDASLMPTLPRGNTNLPTIMMAEKIAAGIAA